MIYIPKGQDSIITTDNVVDYIAGTLDVYLDEVKLGTFPNMSLSSDFIRFEIPAEVTNNMQQKEYTLKIRAFHRDIKTELVILKDYEVKEIKELTKTNQIQFYE